VVYLVIEAPKNDFFAGASVCLFAPKGDDHPEVAYYRVRPGEIEAKKF
jgi:hypothetical protein